MADESHSPAKKTPATPAPKKEPKPVEAKPGAPAKAAGKPAETKPGAATKAAHKPAEAKPGAPPKAASKASPAKDSEKKAPAKKAEDVKIVDAPTPKKHTPRTKAQLTPEIEARLRLRTAIASRRPTFRRQQWYEYKRLEDSGWRRPTGVDSAMRRHFGYEQSVVRIGFRGPRDVRGLHPSGFEEVRVEHVADLAAINPARQAARVSGNLGRRSLRLVYAEADKRGVRILNRRRLE